MEFSAQPYMDAARDEVAQDGHAVVAWDVNNVTGGHDYFGQCAYCGARVNVRFMAITREQPAMNILTWVATIGFSADIQAPCPGYAPGQVPPTHKH